MKQEEINYSDIMSLGFTEQKCYDSVYYKQYGFDYCIIQKELTKEIYIEWQKSTRLCHIARINNTDESDIMAKKPIKDLEQLKDIIDFFTDK